MRKHTKQIMVGSVPVGGNSPITIQSMTNTNTSNIEETVNQIIKLEDEGLDIIRCAVNSLDDAKAIVKIKDNISVPLIADIQFDYKLGLYAVEYGCDCLRINPGNLKKESEIKEIVNSCKRRKIPIRIGVNSGSIHKDIIEKYNGVNVESLVASAILQTKMLEKYDFTDIKLSIKSSDVLTMIESYKKLSSLVDYPLHLGVTEAGPFFSSSIKSSIGIGSLLSQGIGDTIRVSITGDPLLEVKVGKEILKSLKLRKFGVNIVSCPTCARTNVDLIKIVNDVEEKVKGIKKDITIAIMGCPVNGPGEAKEADIGVAFSGEDSIFFKKGHFYKRCDKSRLIEQLLEEINLL
ncbi:flavodoxin-dependent (E)-4-hydroxy-3-methylbut-2-enyl-diphosphate synthase [Citroniella saccharovorans]|uniref:4-hydroxy-3-methylbut-2-en-1-yl diphosphate synthase (flavodoxin) n=1 Tax=Citroniella saccharovorans TaxID=2053367 RepID=A0AAW9MVM3_9FIRM|nr:flavodoxin-dependent (E)-4-hydroxy-3-methylbut-2-enyl-diphosphate synthase [Citroniella saccharovorans]MEB3429639.1 flavodoxin-dependent (E)-4-hydroxy-3-methylbut-2-enyl-diphosphate synthase [Citroniella saccharovorans]